MAKYAGRNWTQRELMAHVGRMDQIAGIKPLQGADGFERGSRMFDVYTGSGLSFRVLGDRALDIAACSYRGLSLAWASSAGDVHPAYYEPDGAGWLRTFPGGLMTTCGLDQFGAPTQDGDEAAGLHGRANHLPASQINWRTMWQDDEYILEVSGNMRQTRLFGENLVLHRRITTRLGANQIDVEDTVTNEGFNSQPHMILYHCNLGFPLLDASSKLHVPAEKTEPRDADASAGLDAWHTFQQPTANYREQVFRHYPAADENNQVSVSLENPKIGLGLTITYDAATLPHLFQWKMMGQGAYVLGIEPANSSGIGGRADARQRGDLPHLEPGESRTYRLRFNVTEI